MISEIGLSWAREWKELAFEHQEMAGDEKFFDLLEETLKDKSPAANQRLAVFYTCIGLGFTGWYTGQPEYLRRKMKEIAARLQAGGQIADAARICADAYEKVDTRDLIEPPGTQLMRHGNRASLGLIARPVLRVRFSLPRQGYPVDPALQKVVGQSSKNVARRAAGRESALK